METDTAVRIGINGFGRVGRCIARQILELPEFQLTQINDVAADAGNFSYLYNFDSTYGRANQTAKASPDGSSIIFGDLPVAFTNSLTIDEVNWSKHGVDIVIEATGVTNNVARARQLIDKGLVKKVVITHAPREGADRTIILGVNDQCYNPNTDHIVASSICDANAIAPVLAAILEKFGIESCFITTLHPWLSYQNLVDSPVASQSNPKHPWTDYALGRSSVGALIPKDTTAAQAVLQVLPELRGKIEAFSYRIPTAIVTSADMTIQTREPISRTKVEHCLMELAEKSPYVEYSTESLISVDFLKTQASSIVDGRWIRTVGDHSVKVVTWYDNEWAYSARVVDLARMVMR